jgi:O-acetyl-ADP-ribose deacetylase (regulator of RNase III)
VFVIHVAGPQVTHGLPVTERHREDLSSAYSLSMNASVFRCKIDCLSVYGIFGFPSDLACEIALSTVRDWLATRPNQLDMVVFDLFTEAEEQIYSARIGHYFPVLAPKATNGFPWETRSEAYIPASQTLDRRS